MKLGLCKQCQYPVDASTAKCGSCGCEKPFDQELKLAEMIEHADNIMRVYPKAKKRIESLLEYNKMLVETNKRIDEIIDGLDGL